MAKAVKMKDIAERLNISTMTVSKALAGKPGVSEPLRERIKMLALEMGYVSYEEPKEERKKSYNIGVILSNCYTENCTAFYWKLYQQINIRAMQQDCFVLLENLSSDDEQNGKLPKTVKEEKVEGILVLGGLKREYLEMLAETLPIPAVYLDFYDDKIREDCVISDSFYGTYQITNYLFDKGHREIAFVGTLFRTKSITDRFLGYEKAMIEHGEKIREDWIIPDREKDRDCYVNIPLPEKMPTAFVCNCDLTANLLIKELQKKGYRIPEDISVVGYDDDLYPGQCSVEITSYRVDAEQMAVIGIEILLNKIEGKDYRKGLHVVEGHLVEKFSVREKN